MRRVCVRGDFGCVGLAAAAWPNPRASTSRQSSKHSDGFERPIRPTPFRFARSNSTVNRANKRRAAHKVRRTGGDLWL